MQNIQEKLEAIRSRQSKKDRQYNGQKKKGNRTNNDQQNITRKLMMEQHESGVNSGTQEW